MFYLNFNIKKKLSHLYPMLMYHIIVILLCSSFCSIRERIKKRETEKIMSGKCSRASTKIL